MKKAKRDIIPQGVRFDVFRRDNFTCVYCGRSSPDVTLECDHKVAVAKGGKDTHDNLVTACFDCNRGKSAKDAPDRPTPKVSYVQAHALVGKFGHSLDAAGLVVLQFEILDVSDGLASLQLFSWAFGEATNIKIVPVSDLANAKEYTLYANEASWHRAADESLSKRLGRPVGSLA